MAETPHDPTSSSCPCRACALNRRRLGTSSPPRAPEPELAPAPAGDAASPPDPASSAPDLAPSRPDPAPLLRIGYATVPKAQVDALVKAYRRSGKAERTGLAGRRRAVIDLAELGLSVRAIAERVDLDPQTVHRWTRGEP